MQESIEYTSRTFAGALLYIVALFFLSSFSSRSSYHFLVFFSRKGAMASQLTNQDGREEEKWSQTAGRLWVLNIRRNAMFFATFSLLILANIPHTQADK